ncbi:Thiamin pyrophosphokinase, catalytic domain [Paracoccus haematequi]|uniref:Thiamine diphosphokinase n=1 Tax=Paracoccus haematequi TaxID=2491866 RepID=A0A3S4CKI9_9RHOB|nr:thiamine diphosphokinase [Paracoccus haematequi]VDS09636.1 Thiamin pyrophosphokinase, catalytic domain [Paracoccus haematequi]
MIPPLVISDRGVTVIGGGVATPYDLQTALAVAPTLVAADGGADRALALGQPPDWVIGDLDSITVGARKLIPAGRIHHVAEQDSTDFTKCLTRIAAPFVMAVGFSGLRLDHTLSALTAMASTPRPLVIMLASDDVVFVAPPRLTLPLMPGTRVSLYPMGPARGISTGLEWPIEGIEFAPGGRVGTSNRANGVVTLRIEGKMLLMLPRNTLASVMTALRLPA